MNLILNSLLKLDLGESLYNLWKSTGLYELASTFTAGGWQNLVMILISCVLFYLAIVKKFEPLLLLPIAFGMFIVNVPGVYHILFGTKGYKITSIASGATVATGTAEELEKLLDNVNLQELLTRLKSTDTSKNYVLSDAIAFYLENNAVTIDGTIYAANTLTVSTEQVIRDFGLFYYIYKGVDWVIFPPIIFLGIGAMTDFGPLIANPKSMLMGAAAQLGLFITFFGAYLLGFTDAAAAAIAIIGGADGPTAIYVAKKLAEDLLPAIAIAAYSYMALIPIIQKPIMRAVTTKKERAIKMKQLRKVSKLERVAFPIVVSLVVGVLLPDAMPLLGMLMLGNLLRESMCTDRLSDTAQNALCNIVTLILGLTVGSKLSADKFLNIETLGILLLGLFAFSIGTAGGLILGKIMSRLSGGKINPMIGAAGVSAVPMAARVVNKEGLADDPRNFLLMHAMGPNVSGVIGSAVAAGVLLQALNK